MQHLQQANVKVGAVGDRVRATGATAAAAPGGEVQRLQQDNVKVGAAGDKDRTAGATAAAAPGVVVAPIAGCRTTSR